MPRASASAPETANGLRLVIVESPAKAKTINKYLGPGYAVLASNGHVRDLESKNGAVDPEHDFAMQWEIGGRANKALEPIRKAMKSASELILATDPDREGEAISWHVREVLADKKLLKDKPIRRVTFNEITESAVREAFERPRDIDMALVDAYLGRRALDYLMGFTLSPVLWRKLPGAKSAGRVQSVALRLICEREAEIEAFRPREYWSIEASMTAPDGSPFPARLVELDGKKLDRFDLADKAAAEKAAAAVAGKRFRVTQIEKKQQRRNPSPPFITSSLQMEASRKLGFGATRTMRVAQKLYEGVSIGGETVGLITYMRTDGVNLSPQAIDQSRKVIAEQFGADYVPAKPRLYKSKAKNAQEAHEAIRPTDLYRHPNQMKAYLDEDGARLYELIWRRMIAAEMESAVVDQTAVSLLHNGTGLRATGSVIRFDGFMKVYAESRGDDEDEEKNRLLPALSDGNECAVRDVTPEQHFTQPPPRYSEASLVKTLEELGIGRPSTYASIMQVLQDREYVRLEKRRFIPEDRGRLVTVFLENFFDRYVEYDFTAGLEEQLDEISGGRLDWKDMLRRFWQDLRAAVDGTSELSISQVIEALDRELESHLFPPKADGSNPRSCPGCGDGRLSLRLGKFGAFVGCSNHPECKFTRNLADQARGDGDSAPVGDRELGPHPETGLTITARKGPYGWYVEQALPADAGEQEKPRRASLERSDDPATITLERAVALLSLPREICLHPEDGKPVTAGIGRFGPYVRWNSVYASIPRDEDVMSIGENRAITLIAEKATKTAPLRELGPHPRGKKPVTLHNGRFGLYVKHGKTIANLRKGTEPDEVTLAQAVELLAAKAKTGKSPKKKAAPGKKAGANNTDEES